MTTSKQVAGFECKFVNKLQEDFQSECPVCELILREPYQVSCCGNSFCQVCIEEIKSDNKPCPECKKKKFDKFQNKGLEQSLYGLEVYCSNKGVGCEWKGELGQLDDHLNLSPQPDKQLEGCEYSEIECIYCSELIKRSNISVHQNDACRKRPFSCEYCHSYETDYEDVTQNHLPVCGYHPVQCPNECGTFPQRQSKNEHVTRDCPHTTIECDFTQFGCDVRLPRKDMLTHLKENLVTHMSLQAACLSQLQASYDNLLKSYIQQTSNLTELKEKCNKLEDELEVLKIENETLTSVEIVMSSFSSSRGEWFSKSFYTHPQGYKFFLRVFAYGNGEGQGTHVSLYLHLKKGENDDHLKWPFRRQITVQLVDQEGERDHYVKIIKFDDTTQAAAERVTHGKRNAQGRGSNKFIKRDRLEPKYLKNDCLRFRITKAKEK